MQTTDVYVSRWGPVIAFRRTFLIVAALVISQPLAAQWVRTNGPYGGDIRCFAVSDSYYFAGTFPKGFYRSPKQEMRWSIIPSTFDSNSSGGVVSVMKYHGARLFAGVQSTGLFASTDDGETWTKLDIGMQTQSFLSIVDVDTLLFVTSPYGDVFRSADSGATWDDVGATFTDGPIRDFIRSGPHLLAAAGPRVFRSTDGGTTWQPIASAGTGTGINAFAKVDSTLFAATSGRGVLRSTDGGMTWAEVNFGLTTLHVIRLITSGTTLLASTGFPGVFRSADGGTTWERADEGLTNIAIRTFMATDNAILAGTISGVFYSGDDGVTWSPASTGITLTFIRTLAVSGSAIFAGLATSGHLVHSSDYGGTWNHILSTAPNYGSITALEIIGSTLYAAGWDSGVLRSTDGGATWTVTNHGMEYAFVNTLAQLSGSLFAGSNKGVFLLSHDTTWVDVSPRLVTPNIGQLVVSGTTLYALIWGPGLYRSTDQGASWTSITTGLPDGWIWSITAWKSMVLAFVYEHGIYRSTNFGSSWTKAYPEEPLPTSVRFHVVGSSIFADRGPRGLELSTDEGMTWVNVNDGLDDIRVRSMAVVDSFLFAGTAGLGVWKRPLAELGITMEPPEAAPPGAIHLRQNYPNPFNPGTMITFYLQAPQYVTLTIYNVLGQEVATLISRNLVAGEHWVTWNPAGIPSGVYFYRVRAGDRTETKKLLFIR